MLHLLNRLQQQHVQAAVQVGDKAEEAAQLRSQVEAAAEAQREAEADAAAARAAAEEAAAGLSRAERKLALLGKERDGLKAILASYDEEYLNQHGGWTGRCWAHSFAGDACWCVGLASRMASRGCAVRGKWPAAGGRQERQLVGAASHWLLMRDYPLDPTAQACPPCNPCLARRQRAGPPAEAHR